MTIAAKSPPPSTLPTLLVAIGDLDGDRFEFFRRELSGEDAFDCSDARCQRLVGELRMSDSDIRRVLIYLNNLYSVIHYPDSPPPNEEDALFTSATILSQLRELSHDGLASKLADKLSPLLQRNPAADWQIKQEVITQGFLPNAVSFDTMVDIRPIFSLTRESIDKYVTIVQFKISTDGEERSEIVIQLDADAVERLKESISMLEKKLQFVNNARASLAATKVDSPQTGGKQ